MKRLSKYRITTDRGTVLVCPRSDNSIIVKSSKEKKNDKA